jgi:ABC-type amino acid transport substrate-binding protein
MALKPIPRLILIATVIGGGVFGAIKFMPKSTEPNYQAQQTQPAPAVAQSNAPAYVTAPTAQGGSYQSIVEKGVVRASVQSPSKPFFYKENGVDKGFNVDFMKLLFSQGEFTKQHPHIVIDSHTVDTYPKVPEALLAKDTRGNTTVDIAIDGLTFADSDLNGVVYSIPYVDDFGYSLITSAKASIHSIDDLRGMTVGVLDGDPDVMAYVKSQLPNTKIVTLSDASINGERSWINAAIKAGKVDAIVYDYPFAVAEIAGTDLQFALAKMPGSDIKYKIGVRKEDSQLLGAINVAISKAKEDPRYGELIKKYFMSSNVAAVRAASGGEAVHVVVQGETLGKIAAARLGDSKRYVAIQDRNNLANPNLIFVGQRLVIPK